MTHAVAFTRIVVVIACFNRKHVTIRCLSQLAAQVGVDDVKLDIVVIDDGSTDGTPEALGRLFPSAVVVCHSGDLYWSRAMSLGMEIARLLFPESDAMLLLNDDVETGPDCVARLRATAQGADAPTVVVGATENPQEPGNMTYSGFRRTAAGPLKLEQVEPSSSVELVDTMNGNIVLVPKTIYELLGPISPIFVHGGGDIDYGYRVREAGFDILLAPGYLGRCSTNSKSTTFRDRTISRRARLKLLISPKGLPPRTFYELFRRHGGRLGRLRFIGFYGKSMLSILTKGVNQTDPGT